MNDGLQRRLDALQRGSSRESPAFSQANVAIFANHRHVSHKLLLFLCILVTYANLYAAIN